MNRLQKLAAMPRLLVLVRELLAEVASRPRAADARAELPSELEALANTTDLDPAPLVVSLVRGMAPAARGRLLDELAALHRSRSPGSLARDPEGPSVPAGGT